ncbi:MULTISPECIES: XRE family transcriptional regulator [Gordonibacter]|uniref:XRE family transcriptional regulator n=1 Tax=Gordonibacter faecis TaxID=3047475 RepID=A0ABT7DIP9_9ACTN|nr:MULTISPECIES: XRE family transcriptional regulator [unclassified Gordonibacter]MDJ1649406.1 XRE family transcriptional regulator [Gordonibacter sp. KGMB12511]HIW75130.1 XRE family transcriptional regulator [Candidatus Gordonibacter avicola]
MREPLTEELLQELLAAPDPRSFAERHRLTKRSLSEYLQYLLDEKGFERSDIVRKAGLNDTFGYQIFMGQRGASRNKVLQLAFAMGLTLKEADRLLQAAGANQLYCKDRRDAIIIFCLDHGYTLQKTDEELYRFGEDTIC